MTYYNKLNGSDRISNSANSHEGSYSKGGGWSIHAISHASNPPSNSIDLLFAVLALIIVNTPPLFRHWVAQWLEPILGSSFHFVNFILIHALFHGWVFIASFVFFGSFSAFPVIAVGRHGCTHLSSHVTHARVILKAWHILGFGWFHGILCWWRSNECRRDDKFVHIVYLLKWKINYK